MKLTPDQSADIKCRWKIVRTDFYGPNGGEIDGEIESADEEAGEYRVRVNGEIQAVSLGVNGIKIVRRR